MLMLAVLWVFAVAAMGLLAAVYAAAVRGGDRRHRHALIGEETVVIDSIGGARQRGHVRVWGEDWPAVAEDGEPIPVGVEVRVVDTRRTTLVVKRIPVREALPLEPR
jgi:membrane protein implicated in regulation of membrane protease activity